MSMELLFDEFETRFTDNYVNIDRFVGAFVFFARFSLKSFKLLLKKFSCSIGSQQNSCIYDIMMYLAFYDFLPSLNDKTAVHHSKIPS